MQNGPLLRGDLHQLFDNYAFSINPGICIPNFVFSIKLQWLNDYRRIRGRISPASISIRNSLIILNNPLMGFYIGTSGRLS